MFLSCILLSAAKLQKTFESRLVHFGSISSSNEKKWEKMWIEWKILLIFVATNGLFVK